MRLSFFLLWMCLSVGAANAADLTVHITDQNGADVPNAVVTFHPSDAKAAELPKEVFEVAQRNNQFDPFVMIVPKGSAVTFANYDSVRHHVFSFSKAKRFDLKLFGEGESRTVDFDHDGVVSVGCNIHDNMISHLKVVDTPFAVRTQTDGVAELTQLPQLPGILRVWHPSMRSKHNEITRGISVSDDHDFLELSIELRRPRPSPESY